MGLVNFAVTPVYRRQSNGYRFGYLGETGGFYREGGFPNIPGFGGITGNNDKDVRTKRIFCKKSKMESERQRASFAVRNLMYFAMELRKL